MDGRVGLLESITSDIFRALEVQVPDRLDGRTGSVAGVGAAVTDAHASAPPRELPVVSTVLITGAGGTGKTYLLDSLVAQLRAGAAGGGRVEVRFATGDPVTTSHPGTVLARLIPELADRDRPVPRRDDRTVPTATATAAGDPIGQAIDTIAALTRQRPLVILVDDAHLADGLSLSTLHRLARAAGPLPLALVVARRGIPSRGPLSMLAGAPLTRQVGLAPLAAHEWETLVESRIGGPAGPVLGDALALAGGNPAHLNLVLDWLEFSGRLHPVPGSDAIDAWLDHDDLLGIFSRSVDSQLQILDPDALQTVRLLAVWGRPVTATEIGRARRQHPSEFFGSIDAAVGAGVVVWEGELIRFGADIVAEIVRSGLDDAMLQLLRTAVGIAEGRAPDRADPMTSPILRVQTSLQIGAELPRPESPHVIRGAVTDLADTDAVLSRATILSDAGRLQEAYALADKAVDAQATTDGRVTLMFAMLAFATIGGRVDDAHAAIAGIRRHELPGDSAEWLDEVDLWLAAMTGNPPRGGRLSELAGADTAPPGITGNRTARAIGMTVSGDCVGALDLLDTVIDSSSSHNRWLGAESPEAAAWPLWVTRFAYGPAGTLTRAPVDTARDNRLVNRWLGPFRQGVLAEAHMAGGELDIASMLFDDALAEARRIGSGWMSTAAANRALIDVHRGAARDALERIELWRKTGLPERFGFRDFDVAATEAHLALRNITKVRKDARTLWARALADQQVPWLLYRAPTIARQALIAEDHALLARIARDVEQLWSEADAPALHGYALLVQAMAGRDLEAAEQAVTSLQSVGDQIAELAVLEEIACIAADRGDDAATRGYAHTATHLAERIGSTATMRRLRERLRLTGLVLGWAGTRGDYGSGWESLTRAESRVSKLVARGLTGPQIADRLGISPRTVQTHVSHALRKLGLSTRAELAAFISRTGNT